MRFLLILALLVASIGFGPPVAAQSHHDAAEHHVADGGLGHGEHEGDWQDKTWPMAHVCAGCALLNQSFLADTGIAPVALPRLPENPPSLGSFHANPIPPPPRLS